MEAKRYPITDKLYENPSLHCSTLAISESLIQGDRGLQLGHPDEKSRNGTLTFVKSEGKTFAITCWHIIKYFRDLKINSINKNSHSLYTMTPRPFIVIDRFIKPFSFTESYDLDIAIRQVRADLKK